MKELEIKLCDCKTCAQKRAILSLFAIVFADLDPAEIIDMKDFVKTQAEGISQAILFSKTETTVH